MDVAFYHDDPSNRLSATVYDPQSSPGSVDSISSTDAGPVCAIAAVPYERFGQDFSKSAALKGMNLQVQSGNTTYSTAQQLGYSAGSDPTAVPSESYRQLSNNYEESANVTTSNNNNLNISENPFVTSTTKSTPEVINSMLKVGAPDFDMLTQYSQAGQQMPQHVYSRSLMQEQEMYVQNYARELARQRTHGGSNPDIATSNQVATPPPSGMLSGSNGAPPNQFESSDSFYNRQQHPDGPSTSAFGAPVSTVHYMNNPQPSHPLLMPHHSLNQIKDELPQTVPVLPKQSISPIDMEEQEVIKTERKRMRNRLAASKCRKRKLERISRLEEKVNNLKQQNLDLSTNANVLRQQVAELKSKVMSHVNSGCQMMMSQPQVTF